MVYGNVKTGISCGIGYFKEKIEFNLGASYSKENYKGDGNLFSTKKVIDENYTNLVVGVRYKL